MEMVILNKLGYPVLSAAIFIPLIGAVVIMLINKTAVASIKYAALAFTLLNFFITIPLFSRFDMTTPAMQFVEQSPWISSWNINYAIGVDGISVLFVLLSTLLAVLCVLVSWTSVNHKIKEFFVSVLLIEGAMIGVFCAMDFFLFYIFWEAMLIPMFLLIGVWGGPNRLYAAIKFFLFTLVGSVLMLVGIVALYIYAGRTFNIMELATKNYPITMQFWLFWAFFAAFAVKVPMFPVHTWLPDAHTEAPTAGSVILAGVLIKMGAYGFLRFSIPLFPDAAKAMSMPMIVLSVIGIVYGAIICLAQDDIKRLIAYSSVSHMGFVTLGIFALNTTGLEGGILQMINHGIITGGMFLMIGIVYERTHTRKIADYGGLATSLPIFSAFFMVFTFASIGLPGTNGFVGEFLIILGGFTANKWAGAIAATGIIIGAGYMLNLYQKVFLMEENPKTSGHPDMNMREIATVVPLLALVVLVGVFPNALLNFMHPSVQHLLDRVNSSTRPETTIAGFIEFMKAMI